MKQLTLIAIVILSLLVNVKAQNIDFTEFKNTPNGKVVYFNIDGLINDDQIESLTASFSENPNILSFRFFNENRCQMEIILYNYIEIILKL